jgi:hypothetical protein
MKRSVVCTLLLVMVVMSLVAEAQGERLAGRNPFGVALRPRETARCAS